MRIKFKLGDFVKYKGKVVRIIRLRFTCGGVVYKIAGNRNWIRESELEYAREKRFICNNTKSKGRARRFSK